MVANDGTTHVEGASVERTAGDDVATTCSSNRFFRSVHYQWYVILDERSPHEPEETAEPDEPDLGPDIPDVAPPDDGGLGPEGTPPALLKSFWSLVLLFNVGLLAASLGMLLIGFRGNWQLGGALFLVGVLALARGVFSYRRIKRDDALWEND